jgi:hypothetical protein
MPERSERYYMRVEPEGRRTFYGPYADDELSAPTRLAEEARQLGAELYVTRASNLYEAMNAFPRGARR